MATLTLNQTIRGITEFLEVATHNILYYRHVYPPDLFVRRRIYDTPVFRSRHPVLNDYIAGAFKAVGEELAKGTVERVVVVIKNKSHVAMERFVFAMQNMVHVEAFDREMEIDDAMTPTMLGQYFRSLLVKLTMVETQLGPLELADDISFAILLELRDGKVPTIGASETDPPPWFPAEPQNTTPGVSKDAGLHMIRAVNTGVINFSLTIQESVEKFEKKEVAVQESQ